VQPPLADFDDKPPKNGRVPRRFRIRFQRGNAKSASLIELPGSRRRASQGHVRINVGKNDGRKLQNNGTDRWRQDMTTVKTCHDSPIPSGLNC
jgi:hypothetical protein